MAKSVILGGLGGSKKKRGCFLSSLFKSPVSNSPQLEINTPLQVEEKKSQNKTALCVYQTKTNHGSGPSVQLKGSLLDLLNWGLQWDRLIVLWGLRIE